MKIAIPTADYPPIEGGISSVTLHLSRELCALGHDVTVIAPWFPAMTSSDAAEPARVIRYRGYGFGWFRFFPMLKRSFSPIRNADLVLGINVSHGGIMAWLLGARYVAFAYAYEFLRFRGVPIMGALLGRVYARSVFTVAISSYTASQLQSFGVSNEQIETIWPGVAKPNEVTPESMESVRKDLHIGDGSLLLAAGRLIQRKGFLTLIDAMPTILEAAPETTLVVVGRGPLQDRLERRISELDIATSVRLAGYVDETDLGALYSLCDVFVMPTGEDANGQVEGFGLVFAEANSYGKPVVAGRSGGVVDAVVDGETGLLVTPNDPADCAKAVVGLLRDPERARAMGEAGRRRVETELGWERFAEKLLHAVDARS